VKIDTATGAVAAVLVLNEKSNPPTTFVREPGTSRGYVLLSRTNETVEIDLNSARATRVVQLPLSLTDFQWFGAAFRDANTLLVAQGDHFLELAADLTLRAKHNLPSGAPRIWGVLASRDARTLYSVSTITASSLDTFLAIDATSFQIKASLHLDGGVFNLPWEHPDAGKLYVLGGMQNGAVLLQVIDAQSFALRKTIRFDDASAPGIAAGPDYPYTYDPSSRTLFVGATMAVLAIDTDRDEIKRVIRLDEIAGGMGIQPNDFAVPNAVGLAFDPSQNRLNIAHLDGSFVSVYDLAKGHFLSPLIPLTGYFPDRLLANDDFSKLLTLNMRSDDISVIDTKGFTVTGLIDICNPLPGGGRQPRKRHGPGCPSSAGGN
jgi:DNA-binding beta-propeller fold protein YncE